MIDTFDSGQTKNEFIKRSIISTIKKKEVKKDEKKDTKKDEKKDTKKEEFGLLLFILTSSLELVACLW